MLADRNVAAGSGKAPLDQLAADLAAIADDDNRAIHIVDLLLARAIQYRASDIHLEAKRAGLLVKYRIDGTLIVVAQLEPALTSLILTRLKVLARLVIYQKSTPQDGRIEYRLGNRTYQFRIAFMPTLHGEKAVVRLAEALDRPLGLDELGMLPDMLRRVRRLITARQGVILLTGPSSSGKTTTMYAMLLAIYQDAGETINIATLEDPVELDLGCISQTPIPSGGEMTYADGLKSLLREDPDVLMIGEVRDLETAQIVIQAGLTGHLVITTIHSGRASSVYTRLLNMGIEPFMVASSVQGTIAQRLVRRLCDPCKQARPLDGETRRRWGLDCDAPIFEPVGCPACDGTGYRGRTGIFELLESNDELQELVLCKAPARELGERARLLMPGDLWTDAMRKVEAGATSVAEACRATGGSLETHSQDADE